MMEYPYGGFWRRAVAAVIDQVILVCLYTLLFVLGALAGLSGFAALSYPVETDAMVRGTAGIALLYQAFCMLLNMGYFTYFHGTMGQTPGKMAMGLKVTQASGEEMTPGLAFLRWVGYIVSALFLLLGYIWIAFDPRKQGWHDKIAGTVVIRKKQKTLDKAMEI